MYEDGETIVVDAMEYEHAPLFPDANGVPGKNVGARLTRWVFNLADNSNTVKRTQIDDLAGEFPRLDERRAGLPYRHGYFAANTKDDGKVLFDAIAHIDHASGKRALYTFSEGDAPGEPVFVSRNTKAEEGDGFLVATVYRGSENRSDFVVFDASDIAKGPIATAHLPRRVPFGFHGNWAEGAA
jgi:carotenoid cleavage dioxygenase